MVFLLNNYIFAIFLAILALSNNFVAFFIGWTGLNLSLYALLSKGSSSYNSEITLKYFLAGAIVTIFLLFGMVFYSVDMFTLDFNTSSYTYLLGIGEIYAEGKNVAIESGLHIFGVIILIFSMLFKLGSFPFNYFLIDLYNSLNYKKTAFIITVPLKLIAFLFLIKTVITFWYIQKLVYLVLIVAGVGSIIVSSLLAFKQYKLQSFWACSYLNSLGYSLVGLAAGIINNYGEVSLFSAKLYFIGYLVGWCGILDIMNFIFYKIKIYTGNNKYITYFSDFITLDSKMSRTSNLIEGSGTKSRTGLLKRNKNKLERAQWVFKLSFVLLVANLLGLPPSLGFFSKLILLLDMIKNLNNIVVLLVVLIFLPLMSFSYLRLIMYVILGVSELSNLFVGYDKNVFIAKKSYVWHYVNKLTKLFDMAEMSEIELIRYKRVGRPWVKIQTGDEFELVYQLQWILGKYFWPWSDGQDARTFKLHKRGYFRKNKKYSYDTTYSSIFNIKFTEWVKIVTIYPFVMVSVLYFGRYTNIFEILEIKQNLNLIANVWEKKIVNPIIFSEKQEFSWIHYEWLDSGLVDYVKIFKIKNIEEFKIIQENSVLELLIENYYKKLKSQEMHNKYVNLCLKHGSHSEEVRAFVIENDAGNDEKYEMFTEADNKIIEKYNKERNATACQNGAAVVWLKEKMDRVSMLLFKFKNLRFWKFRMFVDSIVAHQY